MYVVCVNFTIKPAHWPEFLAAMREQASNSLRLEPDCHRFDVCLGEPGACTFFLYEIYSSRAAFDYHLESAHFQSFDRQVADWVVTKRVSTWRLDEVRT